MPPILLTLFHYFISPLLIIFNQPPPPPRATQSISNPNSTTTTSLPSPPKNLISPTQSDRPILSFNPSHDLESGNQPSPIPIPNNIDIDLPEWKRIGKDAKTVGFGVFGSLITLFVNTPRSPTSHPALDMAYLTFVCLGLASSICLSAFSIIKEASPTVCFVQKKLISFTLFFVALACLVRLLISLLLIDLGLVTMLVLIGFLLIALYLLHSAKLPR
ncbi:hypothetical protein IEQ34_003082 [Dendrobium chrysotoxum]|uniref:Vesicle transport protein n=1 Tax=Dendrobium chrysotoxum TaxID=161865 RepID=A0AAV7HJZ0_DENCH|nr:hypothetical protein IEQ34_003082 [Dendrobium chrysotoxum]